MSGAPAVSLREITEDNRGAVEALAVTEEQDRYVASVTQSLKDARDYPEAMPWYRAVYAGEEPVGVMLSDGVTDDDPTLGPERRRRRRSRPPSVVTVGPPVRAQV